MTRISIVPAMPRATPQRWLFLCPILLLWIAAAPAQESNTFVPIPDRNAGVDQKSEDSGPAKFSGRIHLERGKTRGYLVIQVELKPDHYIYSVTQPGKINPTRLQVLPNQSVKVVSKFSPDRPPAVTKQDPLFGHRVEKHRGTVQFFAQIELQGTPPQPLKAEVEVSGQVCGQESCLPLKRRVTARFAGYFDRQAKAEKTKPDARDSDSDRR